MENQDYSSRERLLGEAHAAPTSPGVYLMKDQEGLILYVGKAKNLKNRLTTYFQAAGHAVARTGLMVSRVERFETILTETEAEALILENTLIKKHRPKFNVLLKDDKAYPYLKIQVSDSFPRIEWTRRVKRDGARYFGPFTSARAAREVMNLLNHHYRLRDCSDNTFRHRTRACILHQMGQCSAPCVGKVSPEDYRAQIQEVVGVLEGKSGGLIGILKEKMAFYATEELFEAAAEVRDQIESLELITATQAVDEANAGRYRDVAAIAREGADAHGVLLQIREGRLTAVRHYHLRNTDPSQTDVEVLSDFLGQYYLTADRLAEYEAKSYQRVAMDPTDAAKVEMDLSEYGVQGPALARPNELLLMEVPEDMELFERTVGVEVRLPESDAEKQLMNVAKINARHGLEGAVKRAAGHGIEALEEIMDKLNLAKLPVRIECYDISNTQGTDQVASRVVFTDGAPNKDLYRRYKIKTVEGSNDFASMREVLGRRFARSEEDLPDLLVVDGGKGQLAQAVAILDELSVQGVGVVGLAKARTESDFKAKEVASSMERIFIPNRKNPVPLYPTTAAYRLLTHIRDEAHRFAISYHRLLRSKRTLKGE